MLRSSLQNDKCRRNPLQVYHGRAMMSFKINSLVAGVEAPPIAEAATWVKSRERNRQLIDLCQALPKYPPAPELAGEIGRLAREPSTNLYTGILGNGELRAALAEHLTEDY